MMAHLPWYYHLVLGGFSFWSCIYGDPPSYISTRTEKGNGIFRLFNRLPWLLLSVYSIQDIPEEMTSAILLMNIFAPHHDFFVQANISKTP